MVKSDKHTRWREYYMPNPNHPYHAIRTLEHLKHAPMALRVGASVCVREALADKNVVENVRTAIRFYQQAAFAEILYLELSESL
jgi:hypothetical protein